jgi:aminoglycoside N3'-acetyltransferase
VIDKRDLEQGLAAIGVRPRMGLMVHSSLGSFGWVEGGAPTVIQALMHALTPEGTLLMPTFNHGAPFHEDGPGVFDPRQTRSGNGIITDRFWRMPGVCRSLNPTHPYAAWGRDAQRYTESHHLALTMGSESPLGLLYREGGYCLLMGVGYHVNTFHHVVETTHDVPCLGKRTEAYPVRMPDGTLARLRTWGFRARSCPLNDCDPPRYAAMMHAVERKTVVGDSAWRLYRLKDAFELILKPLREGLDGLPPCSKCPIRPRQCEFTVESDVYGSSCSKESPL